MTSWRRHSAWVLGATDGYFIVVMVTVYGVISLIIRGEHGI